MCAGPLIIVLKQIFIEWWNRMIMFWIFYKFIFWIVFELFLIILICFMWSLPCRNCLTDSACVGNLSASETVEDIGKSRRRCCCYSCMRHVTVFPFSGITGSSHLLISWRVSGAAVFAERTVPGGSRFLKDVDGKPALLQSRSFCWTGVLGIRPLLLLQTWYGAAVTTLS